MDEPGVPPGGGDVEDEAGVVATAPSPDAPRRPPGGHGGNGAVSRTPRDVDAGSRPRASLGRRLIAPLDPWAALLGLVFWAAALTPTLLPRPALVQGALSGVLGLVGYGIGGLLAGLFRLQRRRSGVWRPPAGARRWVAVAAGVVGLVLLVAGSWVWWIWQNDQRPMVGLVGLGARAVVDLALVTIVVAVVLLAVARLIAGGCAGLAGLLWRRIGPVWSRVVVAAVVVGLVALFVNQVAINGVYDSIRSGFQAGNGTTDAGITKPTSRFVAGGPGSLIPWDTLGRQGRNFAGQATPVADLQRFAGPGVAVSEPIRVYAGLDSAPTPDARAALAVRELERTGAFDRPLLVIATATGSGWVNPTAAAAIEYMWHGDCAIVAQQYSFLPSWMTWLLASGNATTAARALIGAVVAHWETLPAGHRPELVLFGESLGSYGPESALAQGSLSASLSSVLSHISGALFVGPTESNPIWRQALAGRAPGTPVWQPVVPPGIVHVAPSAAQVAAPGTGHRIQYVAHGQDPVTWWSMSSLWSPPEWVTGPAAPGIPSQVIWFPVVTWLQTLADLAAGFSTGPGFGHNYDDSFAQGFAAVSPPPGWSGADTARLAKRLAELNEVAASPSEA